MSVADPRKSHRRSGSALVAVAAVVAAMVLAGAGPVNAAAQNDPPTSIKLQPSSVPENSPVGTAVGNLKAVDADPGDKHTFTLVPGAGDDDNASFTIVGKRLLTAAAFDFEADPTLSIRVQATDIEGAEYAEALTVTVKKMAGKPATVAVDDTRTTLEDTALDLPVSGTGSPADNDTDTQGDALTVTAVSGAVGGTVTITAGTIRFIPTANLCGPATGGFDYTVSDGRRGIDTGRVTVDITCVPDAPTTTDDTASEAEDSAAAEIGVLANDNDPDGDPLIIDSVTQPDNGTVVIMAGSTGLTYEPDPDYCNNPPDTTPDTFTYTLTPGGSTATVSVTVTCADDAPVGVDDSATVIEDDAATAIDVLANDTDVDGGQLTVDSVTQPDHGTVAIIGGGTGVTYEPDADYCNSGSAPDDTFTYTINGGDTATVSVTVACANDATVAVGDSATVVEDDPATAIDVLANDTDIDGDIIAIDSVTEPGNGTVVITGGGTGLTYVPDPDYCNDPGAAPADTFTYTVDGGDTATVSITVTCIDDAPVAVADSAAVGEDSGATAVDVLSNDTDVDAGPKTIDQVTQPANGTVVITGDGIGLTYQANVNYCNDPPGTTLDTFTYTLNEGDTTTVSMTVTCMDDTPVAVDDTKTVLPDSAATAIDVMANDTDVDGGPKAIASASDPDNGTVVLTGGVPGAHTGLTYQPDANSCNDPPATTTDDFTYTLTPGGSTATVSVSVTCVDDNPVAVNNSATVLEDADPAAVDVMANDTDVDGGPMAIASASDPANGTVVLTGGSAGAHTGLTYQPDPNSCNDPPGTTPDTFTYTLNGGSTATVSVTVTCVNDAPVADDETFNGASSAVGNTALVVNDADDAAPSLSAPNKVISGDLLTGDTDVDGPGPLTITPGTFATNDGGSVTIEADGDFTYRPAAATSCTDNSDFFDYTVEDSGSPEQADTGRVTIVITGCVWYVSNNATGNSGTSTAPFDTLAQAETASAAGHTIFVFDGDDTTAGYAAGFNLKANQVLTSEAANLVIGTDTLWTGVVTNRPTLTDNNADVVDLDDSTTIRGFYIDPQGSGGGIAGASGDIGGGTIEDVSIVDTGTAGSQPGLELDSTTGTFNISNLVVSTNGATGVRLHNTTTPASAVGAVFNPASQISITSANAAGLIVTGTVATPVSLGTSTFDAITVTGSGSGGVNLTHTTGATTFGDLALTTTSGATPAFGVSTGGTISVPAAGTANVSASGGPAVDVTGSAGTTLAFDAVSSTDSANDGINLAGLSAGTFTATSGTITGAAGIAFDLDGGSGEVTYPGALNNGAGATAEITNRTGGAVALSGAIADTNDADGGISLSGNTGGSTTFSNPSKVIDTTTSDAVFFSGSDGHTLNLTGGGLDIDTTTGRGIVASDSGTLVVSGTGNTIDSVSATALSVTNTDIGAAGATLQRVSSGNSTAAADPANGIVLNTTGAAGGLTVAANGGTCTSVADCTGGAIQNTTGPGISLTSVGGGVSVTRMSVSGAGDDGIRGVSVNGLSLANSVVLNNGNAVGERGIEMTELGGTGGLSATTVSGSGESNIVISNDTTSLIAFNVTASTIANTNMTTGDDGMLVLDNGSAAMTVSVIGSTFTDNKGDHFRAASDASSTGSIGVTFDNNTLTTTAANDPNVVGGGITLNPGSANDLSFKVRNNNIQQAFDGAITLNLDPSSTAAGSLIGTISGNMIGTAGQIGSGSESGNTVTLRAAGQGLARVAIQNNTIREWTNVYGISIATAGGSADIDATVTGNSLKNPSPFGLNGIRFDAGETAGPPVDDGVLCVAVTGNDATGTGVAGAADIRLRQRFATTIRLPGYSGASNDDVAVESFVQANNTGGPVVDATNNAGGGGGGFTGGAACPMPPP